METQALNPPGLHHAVFCKLLEAWGCWEEVVLRSVPARTSDGGVLFWTVLREPHFSKRHPLTAYLHVSQLGCLWGSHTSLLYTLPGLSCSSSLLQHSELCDLRHVT